MHLNLDAVKKHPWIIAVILFGAFVVYRLINASSGSSTTATTAAPASSTTATNTGATQTALAQIQAGTVNQQTAASVQINQDTLAAKLAEVEATLDLGKYQTDAQVTQTGMQQQVALAQVQASNHQNDVNNATVLAQTKTAADIQSQYLEDAYTLATQHESNLQANTGYILQHAGDKKNSQLDATDQTSLFQTILTSGNPSVAATGTQASTSTATEEKAGTVAQNTAITTAVSGIAKSVIQGLFA